MFEISIGVIFFLCISYYFYKTERNKRDEYYDVHNPKEYFDHDDNEYVFGSDVYEYLTADMMKMRLFRELIISGLPNFSTEYLMKEDEGGKILIREILEREGDKSYSPEEHLWKHFSRKNYSSTMSFWEPHPPESSEHNPEEYAKFQEYLEKLTPDDFDAELRELYDEKMKTVGKWKPLTPKWEEMVTKMFVEIRNYYEKDGKTWSPLETH